MRTRSNKLLLRLAPLLLSLFTLAAEEAPEIGFIRLVNAVSPGSGNVHLEVDGKDLFPKGYQLGQRSGGIGLPSGTKKIRITRDGVKAGETSLRLGVGETLSLIAFAEKLPVEKDEAPRWAIKILRLKQREVARGFRLTVISVAGEAETLFTTTRDGAKARTPARVKRLMTTSIDLGKRAGDVGLYLRDAEQPLSYFRPDAAGNYVVVLYDDAAGGIKAVSFHDPKFVIAG
jgi:hypothetical protein